jgi:hypothetical protein
MSPRVFLVASMWCISVCVWLVGYVCCGAGRSALDGPRCGRTLWLCGVYRCMECATESSAVWV